MNEREMRRLVERYGSSWREARDANGFRIAPTESEPGSLGALWEELGGLIAGLLLVAAATWPIWALALAR